MQSPDAYLTFALEPHRFAVRADCAREVVRAAVLAPPSGGSPAIDGVIRFRGRDVVVLDLRSRLGIPIRRFHPDPHFIIAEAGPRLVALRVDRPPDLLTLDPGHSSGHNGVGRRAGSGEGFMRMPDGLVLIDDLERFLALDQSVAGDPSLLNPQSPLPPLEEMTLVGFCLGGETWGIEARLVFEAYRLEHLIPLPGARPPVAGVSPWRGSVLSVLDLRSVLGIGMVPLPELQHVLVLGETQPQFGVVVDALGEVATFARQAIVKPTASASRDGWSLGSAPSGALTLDGKRLLREYAA
jgi:purine-binding chemotaxis protein CheW